MIDVIAIGVGIIGIVSGFAIMRWCLIPPPGSLPGDDRYIDQD